jgi:hypothetical protein
MTEYIHTHPTYTGLADLDNIHSVLELVPTRL